MKLTHQTAARISIPYLAQDVRHLLEQKRSRYFLAISILVHGVLLYLLMPLSSIPTGTVHNSKPFDIVLKNSQQNTQGIDTTSLGISSSPAKSIIRAPSKPTVSNKLDQHGELAQQINLQKSQGTHDSQSRNTEISEPGHARLIPDSLTESNKAGNKPLTSSTDKYSLLSPPSTSMQNANLIRPTEHSLQKETLPDKSTPPLGRSQALPHTNNESQPHQTLNTQLGQKVTQELKNYLTYPYIARKRGWSGKVMLGFQVDTDGKLLNIHLRQSSGYSVLDNSALSAIHKVKKLTGFSKALGEVSPTINIPVIFQLQQG